MQQAENRFTRRSEPDPNNLGHVSSFQSTIKDEQCRRGAQVVCLQDGGAPWLQQLPAVEPCVQLQSRSSGCDGRPTSRKMRKSGGAALTQVSGHPFSGLDASYQTSGAIPSRGVVRCMSEYTRRGISVTRGGMSHSAEGFVRRAREACAFLLLSWSISVKVML